MGRVVDDARIAKVFLVFRDAARRYGKNVSFGSGTDPRKTYSWRHLEAFLKRTDAVGIEDDMLPYVVGAVVESAGRRELARRGLGVLACKDLVELCCAKLERDRQAEEGTISTMSRSYCFISSRRRNGEPWSSVLLHRAVPDAYPDMVRWHHAGYVASCLLAVFSPCLRAMACLREHEKGTMPGMRELLRTRTRLCCSQRIVAHAERMLGTDFVKE